jgi:hypothetical protein
LRDNAVRQQRWPRAGTRLSHSGKSAVHPNKEGKEEAMTFLDEIVRSLGLSLLNFSFFLLPFQERRVQLS